jgi:hypothetical protein
MAFAAVTVITVMAVATVTVITVPSDCGGVRGEAGRYHLVASDASGQEPQSPCNGVHR